ncbi:glycerophosphodiester phosphodiesterase, partial [Streptomyces albidoflavus]
MTASPASARHPYLDHPGPLPFAHRGGAAGGRENTAAAFAEAVAAGSR